MSEVSRSRWISKGKPTIEVNILKKTWVKMSKQGQDMALQIPMTDECKALVGKALAG